MAPFLVVFDELGGIQEIYRGKIREKSIAKKYD